MDLPSTGHDPVLLTEVLEQLALRPGHVAVDCTTGRGGHTLAIATAIVPGGSVIALDYDPRNLDFARQRVGDLPARFFHGNFAEIDTALAAAGIEQVDAILADLGISTNQLFEQEYGLSFTNDVPLDMRLDPRNRTSARTIVNAWPEQKIADLLYHLADERYSRRIARKIVETRKQTPINTTEHLAELVRSVLPYPRGKGRSIEIDPATGRQKLIPVNPTTQPVNPLPVFVTNQAPGEAAGANPFAGGAGSNPFASAAASANPFAAAAGRDDRQAHRDVPRC